MRSIQRQSDPDASTRANTSAGTGGSSGPREIGAEELEPRTSGDAANVGYREDPDTVGGRPGGATLGSNIGDAGADAGEGSIDATDDASVTGDPDVSPAARQTDDDFGGTSPGTIEPAGGKDPGYRAGGASGALGPEDVDPAAGAPEPDYGPDSSGPEATTGPKGDPRARGADTGLGRAQAPPTEPGTTNLPGPADEERHRNWGERKSAPDDDPQR